MPIAPRFSGFNPLDSLLSFGFHDCRNETVSLPLFMYKATKGKGVCQGRFGWTSSYPRRGLGAKGADQWI